MSAPIIKTTLIFCPFNTSLIKDSCGLRNLLWDLDRLLLGYHPDLVLCAACDTLPMAVNLQRWHIHCDERCSLCGCIGDVATTAFMFCFGWLFACLVTRLLYISAQSHFTLSGFTGTQASESPQGTIPSSLIVMHSLPS